MASTQAESRPSVIDVDELLSRCLGNLQFAERILSVFEQRGATELADLQQAIREKDLVRVAAIAHRFQGACSNTAASGLSQRIAQLRKAACAKDMAEVAEHYRELTKNWAVFVAALAELDWGTDDAKPSRAGSG